MDLKKKVLVCTVVAAFAGFSGHTFAGGAGGGATEVTQLSVLAKDVASHAEAVTQTATQINSLLVMLDNIESLPAEIMGELASKMGVKDVGKLKELATSFAKVKKASDSVIGLYNNTMNSFDRASGRIENLTFEKFIQMNQDLATTRGGVYEQRITTAKAKLKELEEASKENTELINNAGSAITGEVKGLQMIVQSNAKIAQLMIQQQADLANEKQENEEIRKLEEAKAEMDKAGAMVMLQERIGSKKMKDMKIKSPEFKIAPEPKLETNFVK